jgi:VWFA-related protein
MKKYLNIFIMLVLIIVMPLFAQDKHEKIVENVGVNYWLVPLMAIDSSGQAVTDLRAGDIQLFVNSRAVTNFTFIKSTFDVSQNTPEPKSTQPTAQPPVKAPEPAKKFIVLLFDLSWSNQITTDRSISIAATIIKNAAPGSRFIVMTIESFSGLRYITEGGNDKAALIAAMQKKVKPRFNKRFVDVTEIVPTIGGRLTADDLAFHREQYTNYYKRKGMSFFDSFQSLYFYLNGIEERKFVYLFSEGISNSMRSSSRTAGATYDKFLKEAGSHLSRSGAALFLVNSLSVSQNSAVSGEQSLLTLAQASGGKYLTGSKENIVTGIQNMHRAYYEISFPDVTGITGNARNITIKSKRKGVQIISLRTIEKRKTYANMTDMEKEVLAVQLVSGNPLVKRRLAVFAAHIKKTKNNKKKRVYDVLLPPHFKGKSFDLYKLQVNREAKVRSVSRIDKEVVTARKGKLRITFPQEAKGAVIENAYFVLIDPFTNTAWVHGFGDYDPDPELQKLFSKKEHKKSKQRRKAGVTIPVQEMLRILDGAATYCQKLKDSAFHFFCTETVSETQKPLADLASKGHATDISRQTVNKSAPKVSKSDNYQNFITRVTKYKFTYRLIKQQQRIKEEREWLSSLDNVKVDGNAVIKPTAFVSSKAVFGPITILDRSRQPLYKYTFLRYETFNGRRAAVIEAIPREIKKNTHFVYGDIWIDMEDFSILKIAANPRSILGYEKLTLFAKKLRSRLYFSLEFEFGKIHDGIRFPTKVTNIEKYKGGRYISKFWGPEGWQRTRTQFTYKDYRFFNVKVDVSIQD